MPSIRMYVENEKFRKETFSVRCGLGFFHFPFFLFSSPQNSKQANFSEWKWMNGPRRRQIIHLYTTLFHDSSWFTSTFYIFSSFFTFNLDFASRFSSSIKAFLISEAISLYPFLWLHSTSWSSCWHGERVLLGLSTGWSIPSTTFQLLRLRFQTIFTRRCEKNDKWKKSSKFSTDSLSKRTERPRTLTPTEEQVGSCLFALKSAGKASRFPRFWWRWWRMLRKLVGMLRRKLPCEAFQAQDCNGVVMLRTPASPPSRLPIFFLSLTSGSTLYYTNIWRWKNYNNKKEFWALHFLSCEAETAEMKND